MSSYEIVHSNPILKKKTYEYWCGMKYGSMDEIWILGLSPWMKIWLKYGCILISLRRYHQRSVTNQLGALDLIMHQGGQRNQAVTAGHHIVRCGKTKDRIVLVTHCLIFFGDQTLKNVTARTQTFHLQMGDLTMVKKKNIPTDMHTQTLF